MELKLPTISTVLQSLNFNASSSVPARIFRMFAHILPREIGSQPIDFSSVMSNEKYQIFCREISCSTSCGESTSLDDLWPVCVNHHFGRSLQAYKLDELTADDVLDEIHGLWVWVLDFTKDEHLLNVYKIGSLNAHRDNCPHHL